MVLLIVEMLMTRSLCRFLICLNVSQKKKKDQKAFNDFVGLAVQNNGYEPWVAVKSKLLKITCQFLYSSNNFNYLDI